MAFCSSRWLSAAVTANRAACNPVWSAGLSIESLPDCRERGGNERSGYVVVRNYRFIAEQLPQVRKSCHPGELRRGHVGLELKLLQLDLQQIVLAMSPAL